MVKYRGFFIHITYFTERRVQNWFGYKFSRYYESVPRYRKSEEVASLDNKMAEAPEFVKSWSKTNLQNWLETNSCAACVDTFRGKYTKLQCSTLTGSRDPEDTSFSGGTPELRSPVFRRDTLNF